MSRFTFTAIDLISMAGNITEHLLSETGEKTACGFQMKNWKGTSQTPCDNGHCRNCESRVKTMRRLHEVIVPLSWEPTLMSPRPESELPPPGRLSDEQRKAILENLNSVEGADGTYDPS